ncbi:MAG TPA: tripartite tricarboxylate transporter substrate-binding protein [Alphaproteobacteria bacterium]|nr:tripartite tricarboxylate transporter substrate-binding protein [Alphaproteobacteria bacterium]
MGVKRMRAFWCAGGIALAAAAVHPASADDFYKNRQINFLVGAGTGGGYDAYVRVLIRHWPDHIPGHPSFNVQYIPAAGGLVAMNTLCNTSPRDGSTIGAVQNHIGVEPLLGLTGPRENDKYDALKANWIGSATKEVPVVAVWHTTPFKTFKDIIGKEVLVGSSGVATSDSVYPRVMNKLVGTKFKIVEGYKNNPQLAQAMEQGEIQGRAGWFLSSLMSTKPDWVQKGEIRLLVQVATEKYPGLDLPLVAEFTKDTSSRQQLEFALSPLLMGRPYVAPPGVPADRVKLLRDSFMATMKDPKLLAEAKRIHLEISPMSGEEIHALLEKQYAAPKAIVDSVRAMMVAQGQ